MSIKSSVHAHRNVLTTPEEIRQLAQRLSAEEMIALDTEFMRESTFFPIIALIQVATDKESWVIDPLALKTEELRPFLDVLENPKVLKILHAAQADQECIYTTYGVVAKPSFDTAAGASLLGFGESVGLAKLVREVIGAHLPKGHARTDWLARPVQEHLLTYAHQDVAFLNLLARKLLERLDARGRRQWAFELSARYEDKRNYEPNPDGLAAKLARSGRLDRRGYAALRELMAWRERRVREVDVPRRRLADDDVLVALAITRPKDIHHTSAFRGLNRGELKHSGEAILTAIRRASELPENQLPEVPRADVADTVESRTIELIQCFVRRLADELEIASRYLVSADDLLRLIRGRFETVDDMVQAGILTAGAATLMGEELLAMVHGKRALYVESGRVQVYRGSVSLPR